MSNILKIIIWSFKFILANIWMWLLFLEGLLPHEKVKKGDKFLVLEDFEIDVLTHWKTPFTDGFKSMIPKGTTLVAHVDALRLSTGFVCIPEHTEEFEDSFVPENIRKDPKYAGYSLIIRYRDIGKRIKKVN